MRKIDIDYYLPWSYSKSSTMISFDSTKRVFFFLGFQLYKQLKKRWFAVQLTYI